MAKLVFTDHGDLSLQKDHREPQDLPLQTDQSHQLPRPVTGTRLLELVQKFGGRLMGKGDGSHVE